MHRLKIPTMLTLVLVLAFPAAPLASHKGLRHQSVARKMHYPSVKDYGRLIPAPAGSFACITDGPPRPCNQNIWVYGY